MRIMKKSLFGLGRFRRVAIMRGVTVAFATLALVSHAVCSEIYDAVRLGGVEWAGRLIQADPNLVFCKDKLGRTPLHYAVQEPHKGVVELLLTNKADVNAADKNGDTPLHLAASAGTKALGELLLRAKADVNARNRCGVTPFHVALCADNKNIAELLRQHGGHE